jgi:chemotaxis protein methyltransferase CheR
LLTGASDPVVGDGALEPVATKAGVFYRRPAATSARPRAPALSLRSGEREPVVSLSLPEPTSDGGQSPPLSSGRREGPDPDPLTRAREAFARGEYELACTLATGLPDPEAAVLGARAVANLGDTAAAERLVAAASARHPTSVELHLLHAVLLIDLRRHADAGQAARRALYLDRGLVIGHFLLGTALAQLGELAAARKAFQNARALCASLPPDLPVPFGDGQRAALLAEAAGAQLRALGGRKVS